MKENVHQCAAVYGGLIPKVASLLPLVVVATVVSVVLRNRWMRLSSAMRLSFADAGLVVWVLIVVHLVTAPQAGPTRVLLVPGSDVLVALHGHGESWPWLQLLGNVLLLFPLGAALPLRLSVLNTMGRITAVALFTTLSIEASQYFLLVGRVVSADDVLLNTTGALLGALLTRPWWGMLREPVAAPWLVRVRGLFAEPSGRHALRVD